jgi:Lrp/AsnC family leucine-responsive transcriptional regulator
MNMDETNLHLLRLLQEDGRMTVADLARAVARSESTVRERLDALEEKGVLTGYHAQVDWSKAGLPATAVVRARCDLNQLPAAKRALSSMPNVTRALFTTGPRPVLLHMRVRDIQHLQSLLREALGSGHLMDVEAEMAIESLVDARPPGLAPAAVQQPAAEPLLRIPGPPLARP